jgi:hypothetical protein
MRSVALRCLLLCLTLVSAPGLHAQEDATTTAPEPTATPAEAPTADPAPSEQAASRGGPPAALQAAPPAAPPTALWSMVGVSALSWGGAVGFLMAAGRTEQDLDRQSGTLLFDRNERIRLGDRAQSQRNMGYVLAGTGTLSTVMAAVLGAQRRRERRDGGSSLTWAPHAPGSEVGLTLRWLR